MIDIYTYFVFLFSAYGARTDRKKPRAVKSGVKFTAVQMAVLVKLYQKDTKPSVKKLQLIAETLSLEIKQIRTWFNNQRARNFPAGKEFSAAGIPEEFNCFVNDF